MPQNSKLRLNLVIDQQSRDIVEDLCVRTGAHNMSHLIRAAIRVYEAVERLSADGYLTVLDKDGKPVRIILT